MISVSGLQRMANQAKDLSDYTYVRTIGAGAYGEALLYMNKQDRKKYVIKKMNIMDPDMRRSAETEYKHLSSLTHPNIVAYKDYFTEETCSYKGYVTDNVMYIIMEFCEGGDLAKVIKTRKRTKKPIEEELVLNWTLQICLGLQYLHEHNVIHRDLKPPNIFITVDKKIKIGDFGISRELVPGQLAETSIGTPLYLSPELQKGRKYDNKVDIWCLGCCVQEMITFEPAIDPQILQQDRKWVVTQIPKDRCSDALRNLVTRMLNKKPSNRPSVDQLLQTPLMISAKERMESPDSPKPAGVHDAVLSPSSQGSFRPSSSAKPSSPAVKSPPNVEPNRPPVSPNGAQSTPASRAVQSPLNNVASPPVPGGQHVHRPEPASDARVAAESSPAQTPSCAAKGMPRNAPPPAHFDFGSNEIVQQQPTPSKEASSQASGSGRKVKQLKVIDGDGERVCDMAVLNHKIYVLQYRSSEVAVYTKDFRKIARRLTINGLASPCNIIACPKTQLLYVSDSRNNKVYRTNKKPVKGVETVVEWGVESQPDGLAVTSRPSVFVSLPHSRLLREYDRDGRQLTELRLPDVAQPRNAILFGKDSFLMCYGSRVGEHGVCVVDGSGKQVKKFDRPPGSQSLTYVYSGLAVTGGKRSRVYVVDSVNGTLLELDDNLTFVGEIRGLTDDFRNPFRMCLDEDGKRLYVSMYKDRCSVVVLKL